MNSIRNEMFEESSDVVGQGQQAVGKETDERAGSDGQEENRSDGQEGEEKSDVEEGCSEKSRSGGKRGQPEDSDEEFGFDTAAPSRHIKKLKAMGRKPQCSETSSSEDDEHFFEPATGLKPGCRGGEGEEEVTGGEEEQREGQGGGEVGQAGLE